MRGAWRHLSRHYSDVLLHDMLRGHGAQLQSHELLVCPRVHQLPARTSSQQPAAAAHIAAAPRL